MTIKRLVILTENMKAILKLSTLSVIILTLFRNEVKAGSFLCDVVGGFLKKFTTKSRHGGCSTSCVVATFSKKVDGVCTRDGECQ